MSAEIILKREQLDEVQRRAFHMIDLIINHVVDGLQDKRGLVFGEIDLSPKERVLLVQDLATPQAPGLPSVLEKLQEIAPHHLEPILVQFEKDRQTLENA